MRVWLAAAAVMLVAGCSSGDREPAQATPDVVVPAELPEGVTRNGTTLVLDQAALAYEGEMRHFILEAQGNLTYTLAWDAVVPTGAARAACTVGMAEATRGNGTSPLGYFAVWTAPTATLGYEARVLGQTVQGDPFPFPDQGLFPAEVNLEANGTLSVGERLSLWIGGSSSDVFGWSDGFASRVALDASGPMVLHEAPPALLACGFGARGAQGSSAGLSWYAVDAEVGGTVGLATRNGTVAFVAFTDRAQRGQAELTLALPDGSERSVEGPLALAMPEAGDAQLRFGRHTSAESVGWLFVDADWTIPA